MKDQKNKDALFDAFGRLSDGVLDEASHYRKSAAKKGRYVRRTAITLLAAALSLVLVTVTVVAAVPALRRYLNLDFVGESNRQETVPEGWVGIYTAEDLDSIRNDLDGKYILMNDLTFSEDAEAFTPIGTKDAPFTGQFDGNGYVIRKLVIDMTIPQTSNILATAGLFGYCEDTARITTEENEFPALWEVMETVYGGLIQNLGIEESTVTVSCPDVDTAVGMIVGKGTFLTACYAKNCTLNVQVSGSENLTFVGTLAGDCLLLDSCYTTDNTLALDYPVTESIHVSKVLGGLCGNAYTVVTSYGENNTIHAPESTAVRVGELGGHVSVIPHLMTEAQFMTVRNNLLAYYEGGANNFYYKQFCSYFLPKTLSAWTNNTYYYNPTFFVGPIDPTVTFFVYDPTSSFKEDLKNEETLISSMPLEDFTALCAADNLKVGIMSSYVIDSGTAYAEESFPEFDFDTIWQMKDGRPTLRIFE